MRNELTPVENQSLVGKWGTLSARGLELRDDTPFEVWEDIGRRLRHVRDGVQWWIGDWLRFGERKYGEMYAQALDSTNYDQHTLENLAYVAGKVESSRRRELLSFSHHAEVASLPPEQQDTVLQAAETDHLTRAATRQMVSKIKRAQTASQPWPEGRYRVIYADPPWSYADHLLDNYGAAEHHYATMSLSELYALPVARLATEDAVFFLWATSPMLPDALKLLDAWAFEYKACFVWDKVRHNYGHYNSVRHEFLLLATRGQCPPDTPTLIDSVQSIERTETHSQKPEEFRRIIDALYPHGPRIELFARWEQPVPDWERWGNE